MTKLLFIIISIAYFLVFSSAIAGQFHPIISTSISYLEIKDPNYPYTDKYRPQISSVSVGGATNYNKVIISASTNRLLYKATERKVSHKGMIFDSAVESIVDNLSIGYSMGRWQPFIFGANARIIKTLKFGNKEIGKKKQATMFYGAGVNYFLTKNLQNNFYLILPNKKVYSKGGVGIGLTYVF